MTSGERFTPITLPAPDWKETVHTLRAPFSALLSLMNEASQQLGGAVVELNSFKPGKANLKWTIRSIGHPRPPILLFPSDGPDHFPSMQIPADALCDFRQLLHPRSAPSFPLHSAAKKAISYQYRYQFGKFSKFFVNIFVVFPEKEVNGPAVVCARVRNALTASGKAGRKQPLQTNSKGEDDERDIFMLAAAGM